MEMRWRSSHPLRAMTVPSCPFWPPRRPALAAGLDALPLLGLLLCTLLGNVVGVAWAASLANHGIVRAADTQQGRHLRTAL